VAEPTVESSHAGRWWVVDPATYGRVVAYVLAALAVSQLVKSGLGVPHPGILVESVGYLLFFGLVLSLTPVRRWLSAIPRPHRLVIVWFSFCVLVGQLTYDNRKTFPFPAWMMYGKAERQEQRGVLEYYRYRGVDASGHEVNVDPAHVLGFVNVAEIASHVRFIARDSRLPEGHPKRDVNRGRLNDLLLTIARGYNLKHPDAPLRSLEFLWYSWDYKHGPSETIVPEPMLKVEIPEGGAK
jgi:hypothetical protein